MTYFLKVKSLAVAQLPLSRHSSSRLGSALNLRQFRSAVRWADYLALDSLVTLISSNLAALRFLVKLSLSMGQTDVGYNRYEAKSLQIQV